MAGGPFGGSRRRAFFTPPAALRQLPLDLNRSNLVSRDPNAITAAFQELYRRMAGGAMPAAMLPPGMLLQQWKREPGGSTTGEFQPARRDMYAAVQAMFEHNRGSVVPQGVQPQGVPTLPLQVAADQRGAAAMPPIPLETVSPPLRRGLPNDPPPRTSPPPDAFVAAQEASGIQRFYDRRDACNRAILESRARVHDAQRRVFGG